MAFAKAGIIRRAEDPPARIVCGLEPLNCLESLHFSHCAL